MYNIKVLNVKLPFIEAIEHLYNNKEDYIACVCYDEPNPIFITLENNNELCVVDNKSITKKTKLLTIEHVLHNNFYLIIEDRK